MHGAARQSLALFNGVRSDTLQSLAAAKEQTPALMTAMRFDALATLGEGRAVTRVALNTVLDRTAAATRTTAQAVDDRLQRVAERASGAVQAARGNAQALMREVTGQGPAKTLNRGFAIVRNDDGHPVTSSAQAKQQIALNIQF